MKTQLKRLLVGLLSISTVLVSLPATEVSALPSKSVASDEGVMARNAQIEKIMSVLERPDAQAHLTVMGINKQELRSRLSQLDDEQLARVSEKADTIKAAGSGEGVLVAVLIVVLIVFLVVMIFHYMDH